MNGQYDGLTSFVFYESHDGYWAVDNIVLEAGATIPVAGTLAILGVGAVPLMLRRRRKLEQA